MRQLLVFALVTTAATSAHAQTRVGVSIGIQQPGVYGRIDIGDFPPPTVVVSQPVIVTPRPVHLRQDPIYLYVPPGHQKNWAKHCGRYGACGQAVYFVREDWVRERHEAHRQRESPGEPGDQDRKHKGKSGKG